MKLVRFLAASSILLGATVAASAAHYRMHHYGPYGASGTFANVHGARGDRCPIRYNQRAEQRTQDRFYQQSLGKPC